MADEEYPVLSDDQLRRRKQRETALRVEPADPERGPDELVILQALIRGALDGAGLTIEERCSLALWAFGLEDGQVGMVIGRGRQCVVSRRQTARRKLAASLAQKSDDSKGP
jgi:hypothetical protein